MPKYLVEQREIHHSKYVVQADSKAEAIVKVLEDDPNKELISTEYSSIDYDHGMSLEEAQQNGISLDELRFHGVVQPGSDYIESISLVSDLDDED